MKVCALSGLTRQAGGLYYAVSSLCKAINEARVAVTVCGRSDPKNAEDLTMWAPVPVTPYRAFGPLGSSLVLRRNLRSSGADLVHQHGIWMDDQWAVLQWQRITRRPVVISPHGMLEPWAVRNSAWKKMLIGRLFANASLNEATCLHALCESEAVSMRAYGLQNPIAVIPNGIELPADVKTLDTQRRKILLFLGRLHPKKGIANLLAAWAHESPRMAGWDLVIAGWDQAGHADELKRQVAALGIGATVRFAGPLFGEAKDHALRTASAFVLPSYSEGLPMAVLEAWAYGLPVLMTRECNLPEGFAAQAAIEIVPDPESIQAGLQRLAGMNDDGIARMGRNGRTLVAERFAWPHIAEQMAQVYRWVLVGGDVPACVR